MRSIVSWKVLAHLSSLDDGWATSAFWQDANSQKLILSDLSKHKAYNFAYRLSSQSFHYSIEKLNLALRGFFLATSELQISDCTRIRLAEISAVLQTNDFEIVAICHSAERNLRYIFFDDEDYALASRVLDQSRLVSASEYQG